MTAKKRQTVFADNSDGIEGLTQKQNLFVFEFTSGLDAGNAAKSAQRAGYSAKCSQQIACALVKLPHVAAAVDAALRAAMGGILTAKAVQVIRSILDDKNAPLKLKGEMACKVVEFSGIVERVRIEKGRETGLDAPQAGPKRLGEMTRDELESMVRNGAALLQAAAALPPAGPILEGRIAENSSNPKPDKPCKANGIKALEHSGIV
jgi:hypothetical protein